jgi:dTDP-glucose 4,6-dehydratase
MKILITGGCGFIGSNFVRHTLKEHPEYKMIVLDALTYAGCMDNLPRDPRVEFCFGNVCNAELVNKLITQVDAVVHFAAESHVTRSIFDNLLFFETDVLGTQAVANAVAEHGKHIERFVHISTSEVYGSAHGDYMSETDPLEPASPYAAAKAGADRLVYSYWNTYGVPAVILRPFNNLGKFQHLEKLIPRFITSCILNEPLNIHGDGSASRDWVYVEDTCRAVDLALHCDLKKVKGEVINIGSGRSVDIITIAKMVCNLMDRDESLIHYIEDRPGQVIRHTSSTDKSLKLLNWKAEVKFEDGLERTIAWYKDNQAWWERQMWMRSIPIITKDGKKVTH